MKSFEFMSMAVPRPDKLGDEGCFWRKEDPIVDLESRIIVKGGMWPHQREWWNLPNFIKVLVGGYGSGKSFVASKRIIALALQNAPIPVAMVSPSFPIARATVIQSIMELLQGKKAQFGRQLWWKYNKVTHEFLVRYKGREGRILIYSGDDPLSLRGPNLAAAGIDEPFIQDEEVYKQMIARCRHPESKQSELFLSGTPENLSWGYDLAIGEMKDRQDVGVVFASTRGNLALDPAYIKRLEASLSPKAAQAYIDGKFVNLSEGTVYYGFDSSINVREMARPDYAELVAGMDFNVNPMSATVSWMVNNHMHVIDAIEIPDADTEIMCDRLKHKYPELITICPDASGSNRHTASAGRSDFTIIKEKGFQIRSPAKNPNQRDRENAVNGKLRPREGVPSLTIDPKCKNLIKYMSTYSHELKTKKNQRKMSHLLDALGYPVAYFFPVTRDVLTVHRLGGL